MPSSPAISFAAPVRVARSTTAFSLTSSGIFGGEARLLRLPGSSSSIQEASSSWDG